jgi:hypothetical protein
LKSKIKIKINSPTTNKPKPKTNPPKNRNSLTPQVKNDHPKIAKSPKDKLIVPAKIAWGRNNPVF